MDPTKAAKATKNAEDRTRRSPSWQQVRPHDDVRGGLLRCIDRGFMAVLVENPTPKRPVPFRVMPGRLYPSLQEIGYEAAPR